MAQKRPPRGRSGPRFVRKLHVAFGAMLLVTLALAWYFNDTVKWYEHDVQQISLSNQILQNYQSLARHHWRLLRRMDQALGDSPVDAEVEWAFEVAAIEQSIEALRRDLASEANHGTGQAGSEGLSRLADVERVQGPILEAQARIAQAVGEGHIEEAAAELRRLKEEGLVTLFEQIIDGVIDDREEATQRSQRGAVTLAGYITGLLPVLMVFLVSFTLFIAWLYSRNLTRSVRALHQGAMAFSAGQLHYRIPDLREVEFSRLAEGFNAMARELAEHRAHLDEAKVRLEAVVQERTRALKESNEKLAAIDDNRRQLVADISHEFRTPLTVIQGEAEIALRRTEKDGQAYRDSLRRVLEQAKQTTRLVDDLLFIARAEVGEPRLEFAEAPVSEILDSVCEDFTAAADRKGVTIQRDLPKGGPVLFADPGRLRQVFGILVDNAIKYSREGQEVEVALLEAGDTVTITVSDRGIGLSEDELKHVFLRFYRSKRAENQDGGSGLGLPVAKAIVEAHDGTISLESRSGGGIVSTVRIPLDRALDKTA